MSERPVDGRDFCRDPSQAMRAADEEPVFITHEGEVSHVLPSAGAYRSLTGERKTLADILAMEEDVEFEPERIDLILRPVDLS